MTLLKNGKTFAFPGLYSVVNDVALKARALVGPRCLETCAYLSQRELPNSEEKYASVWLSIKEPFDLSSLLDDEDGDPEVARVKRKIKSRTPDRSLIAAEFHECFVKEWHSSTRNFSMTSVSPCHYNFFNWVAPYSFRLDGWQASDFSFREILWTR